MRAHAEPSSPVVVLIEAEHGEHHHGEMLSRAGFGVVSIPTQKASVDLVLEHTPDIVAAELTPSHEASTLEFVRRFRERPETRLVPFVVYGHSLRAQDIEAAARAGALWLQLEPSDGARLIAAARGLVAAARKETQPD
jgi:CheY-like chemotaxis protein